MPRRAGASRRCGRAARRSKRWPQALAAALGTEPVEDITRSLRATSAGLSQVVGRAGLDAGESLLIIADQFEELFRFDVTRDAAGERRALRQPAARGDRTARRADLRRRHHAVGVPRPLLGVHRAGRSVQPQPVSRAAADARRAARSDRAAAEAVRHRRRRRRSCSRCSTTPATIRPAAGAAARAAADLSRVGAGRRHRRIELRALRGDRRHRARARSATATRSSTGLDASARQKTAEKLFRSLTVAQGGVALRRPRRCGSSTTIAGAVDAGSCGSSIDAIVTTFAIRDNSFLMLSSPALTPDTVVDITHESLIRKWKRLRRGCAKRARSAEWYADLARDVVRYRTGEVSLWQDPELAGVQQRRQRRRLERGVGEPVPQRRRSAVRGGAVVPRREHQTAGAAAARKDTPGGANWSWG